jgi:ferrochelatase
MGMINEPPIGVLLMAYGSPDSLDEIEPYLLDIRGGRATPQHLVAEVRSRYAQIGGRSPLLDLTRAQADALEQQLNQRTGSRSYRVYVGMRHWQPRLKTTVAQMASDGIQQAVALVMAPHSSQMSTGAYFANLNGALQATDASIDFVRIESWHSHPALIAALAEHTRAAIAAKFSQPPYIIFTAHSLPVRILENGDPYADQLYETAALVAKELNLDAEQWCFSFQSAGASEEQWLGPPIEATIKRLAAEGRRELLVVPVGFLCDHVEILYDIDIAARQLAESLDVHLERSASLNDDPQFIQGLADLVQSAAHSQLAIS